MRQINLPGAGRYNMPKSKSGKLVKKTTTTLIKKQPRRTVRRRTRRSRRMRTVKIPAAQGVRVPRASFRRVSSRNNEQEIILEGEDLIIPTPDALPTGSSSFPIFLSIPANPLYWKGTRVSGIAAVYQQYRPLKFEVEYVPQVPVTCPGQVIYGTLYNKGVSKESFQQTLMTSNGGGMTQCYLKSHSHVICNKKTLPLTLYNTYDSMNENVANPFTWCAHYSGQWSSASQATTSQPGWVWVKWKYLFSVGLGSQAGEVIVYNQTDQQLSASNNFFAGWGVALSYLKDVAVKLLTKIAIVLLEETEVQVKAGQRALNSKLGIGSTFSVDPASIGNAAANDEQFIRVRDDAGNEFEIPENVRVVVYQNGDTYEVVDTSYQLEGVKEIYFGLYLYNSTTGMCNWLEPTNVEGPLINANVMTWNLTVTGDVVAVKFIFQENGEYEYDALDAIIQASSSTNVYVLVLADQYKNANIVVYNPSATGVGREMYFMYRKINTKVIFTLEDMMNEGYTAGRRTYFKDNFVLWAQGSPMN